MKITNIRNTTASIASDIADAYIDFCMMNAGLAAARTDLVRNDKQVAGGVLSSNFRFGVEGLRVERSVPRLLGTYSEHRCQHFGAPVKFDNAIVTIVTIGAVSLVTTVRY